MPGEYLHSYDMYYVLWTDALHLRVLAKEAKNKWDRATYVRSTIVTSWTVLEMMVGIAVDDNSVSRRFKDRLIQTLQNRGLGPLDWSQGIWQQVSRLNEIRKNVVHVGVEEAEMFPSWQEADKAVDTVRNALIDIFTHCKKEVPVWIYFSESPGYDTGNRTGARLSGEDVGAKDDPMAFRITYVERGTEYNWLLLLSCKDYKTIISDALKMARAPISEIRVYQKGEIIYTVPIFMRGIE